MRIALVACGAAERVVLGDDVRSVVPVAVPEEEGLRDEPHRAEHLRRREQVARPFGAQPIGEDHAAVPPGRLLQGGELVDDGVGGESVDGA